MFAPGLCECGAIRDAGMTIRLSPCSGSLPKYSDLFRLGDLHT
jgi:hypothetical protein